MGCVAAELEVVTAVVEVVALPVEGVAVLLPDDAAGVDSDVARADVPACVVADPELPQPAIAMAKDAAHPSAASRLRCMNSLQYWILRMNRTQSGA
jgi:hypothetical protein